MVEQSAGLLSGTIRENIAYGKVVHQIFSKRKRKVLPECFPLGFTSINHPYVWMYVCMRSHMFFLLPDSCLISFISVCRMALLMQRLRRQLERQQPMIS